MSSTKKYRVLLKGENFLVECDGTVERWGFYTTRFVEAVDEDHAEQTAVDLIRNDARLREAVHNERSDPPMIFLEEIDEIATFESQGAGYTFYKDDPAGR